MFFAPFPNGPINFGLVGLCIRFQMFSSFVFCLNFIRHCPTILRGHETFVPYYKIYWQNTGVHTIFHAPCDSFIINEMTSINWLTNTWPPGYKTFSMLTQLSTKFILLINVKMPTIVGILTFISMMNTTSERLKARNFFICQYFSFYEQLKCRAQLS